ncbi:MAG: putative transcriptional regulator, ArsR family protein [Pseudohongiella sp.]|nr:MAG: putative transcriptional regulator, ArsR family protein [Pseudohongiella sp.]
MGMYSSAMSRVKTTYDAFSAIGDPKRRALIEHLALKEMTVNELVSNVDLPQPTVSKHLGVLRKVGIVSERREGRYRLYRVEPTELRPIREWMHQFEKYWGGALDELDSYLTQIQVRGDKREH